jgi:glycosyltransferase involved in cell wall biosynthesis
MNNQNEKIKVAFILWSLIGMGGSERVVYDITRNLDRQRYSVLIISFEDGPVRTLYEKLGIKVYTISKKNNYDLGFVHSLRKILKDEAINIVNPHHFGPLLYTFVATRLMNIKLVYTEHSRWQLEQLTTLKKVLNLIMLWRSAAVVAISKQTQNYYSQSLMLRESSVHLITNGIDIAIYKKKKKCHLRQSLGIGDHEKVIGMVAHLRPEKNHKLLISAFSNLARIMNDVKLILVGADGMDGEIQKYAAQSDGSDKILFLGSRNDIPELLDIFDIFCLPSVYEGLPLTILEAMAAGVPVIGSDVLGINEVVVNNVNGLLFPSNDDQKLTETLLLLLKDSSLRYRLSSAGKSFVAQQYSLDNMIKKYDELFQIIY